MNVFKIDNRYINVDSIEFIEIDGNNTEIGFNKYSISIDRNILNEVEELTKKYEFLVNLKEGSCINLNHINYIEFDGLLKVNWKNHNYTKVFIIEDKYRDDIHSLLEGVCK